MRRWDGCAPRVGNGPTRGKGELCLEVEARFPFYVNSDGTVSSVSAGSEHDLFTITGMTGRAVAAFRSRTLHRCKI